MKRIAVLGSAFDPPTLGHFDVIKQCLEHFDEVWLVPSFRHAFGKNMSPYSQREEMVNLFLKDINHPQVKVVACEPSINPEKNAPIYSIDLLTYLKKKHPNNDYSLVIGPDNNAAFEKFHQFEKLKRDYAPFIAKENIAIRSTKVRKAIATQEDITRLVTDKVAHHITKENLYISND